MIDGRVRRKGSMEGFDGMFDGMFDGPLETNVVSQLQLQSSGSMEGFNGVFGRREIAAPAL